MLETFVILISGRQSNLRALTLRIAKSFWSTWVMLASFQEREVYYQSGLSLGLWPGSWGRGGGREEACARKSVQGSGHLGVAGMELRADSCKHSESWGARQWGQWRNCSVKQEADVSVLPQNKLKVVIKRSMVQGRGCPQPLSFPSPGQKWPFQGPWYCSPPDSEVPTELGELLKGNECSGWPTWCLLTWWMLLEGNSLPCLSSFVLLGWSNTFPKVLLLFPNRVATVWYYRNKLYLSSFCIIPN